jgi:hypothetical protein
MLGLTGRDLFDVLIGVLPALAAVLVVWLVWRWAKRDEAAERDRAGPGSGESG